MLNSLYGHLVYNTTYQDYFEAIRNWGGSEHIALFASDTPELDETSVHGQRIPIIVKNVPNNAPMGNTIVPLHQYYDSPYGPEQHNLSGLNTEPLPEIDYTDTLEDALLDLSWPNGWPTDWGYIYFFPDNNTILYCVVAYDLSDNAFNTVDLTIKLAVATQNAATGEIIDEQIFELPTVTNLVVATYFEIYGLKILGTNSYCVFLQHSNYGDIRVHLFITLNTDRITVNDQSWQVLRNPRLRISAQAQNNLKNWIGHVAINDTTYVLVENVIEYYGSDSTAVLAIDKVTNNIARYICNYYFYYES